MAVTVGTRTRPSAHTTDGTRTRSSARAHDRRPIRPTARAHDRHGFGDSRTKRKRKEKTPSGSRAAMAMPRGACLRPRRSALLVFARNIRQASPRQRGPAHSTGAQPALDWCTAGARPAHSRHFDRRTAGTRLRLATRSATRPHNSATRPLGHSATRPLGHSALGHSATRQPALGHSTGIRPALGTRPVLGNRGPRRTPRAAGLRRPATRAGSTAVLSLASPTRYIRPRPAASALGSRSWR